MTRWRTEKEKRRLNNSSNLFSCNLFQIEQTNKVTKKWKLTTKRAKKFRIRPVETLATVIKLHQTQSNCYDPGIYSREIPKLTFRAADVRNWRTFSKSIIMIMEVTLVNDFKEIWGLYKSGLRRSNAYLFFLQQEITKSTIATNLLASCWKLNYEKHV